MMVKFFKRHIQTFSLLLPLLLGMSWVEPCLSNETLTRDASYTVINVPDAYDLYKNGAKFVDTRSWFEMSVFGTINGALPMRDSDVYKTANKVLPDLDAEVVLYCAVGVRASSAAAKLKQMGYKSVYVLGDGKGYSDWKKQGLPTSK